MHTSGFADFLKPLLARGVSRPFDTILKNPRFIRLTLGAQSIFNWPKAAGVYVIRRANSDGAAIYVGMAGRMDGKGRLITRSGLNKRVYRWTPYFFDLKQECFRYGPEGISSKGKAEHLKAGYKSKVPFMDLEIDCFTIGVNDRVAPAAIEAVLLQAHFEQCGCLPKANRQF